MLRKCPILHLEYTSQTRLQRVAFLLCNSFVRGFACSLGGSQSNPINTVLIQLGFPSVLISICSLHWLLSVSQSLLPLLAAPYLDSSHYGSLTFANSDSAHQQFLRSVCPIISTIEFPVLISVPTPILSCKSTVSLDVSDHPFQAA